MGQIYRLLPKEQILQRLQDGTAWLELAAWERQPHARDSYQEEALSCLTPVAEPIYRVPTAALLIGTIWRVRGLMHLVSGNGLTLAHPAFEQAAKYLLRAANMKDYEGNLAPAKAQEKIASLHIAAVMRDGHMPRYPAFQHIRSMRHEERLRAGYIDYPEAVKWRTRAAEAGLLESQCKLACMYRHGIGVERSPTQAYRWAVKAWCNPTLTDKRVRKDVAKDLACAEDAMMAQRRRDRQHPMRSHLPAPEKREDGQKSHFSGFVLVRGCAAPNPHP